MKNLKTPLLTLFLFIGFIVPSCNDEDGLGCNCEEFQYFDVEGLELNIYGTSSSDPVGLISPNDTILFEDMSGIQARYNASYHGSVFPSSNWSFSLMNTASACSCAGGSKGSKKEKLVSLLVTTINDYDADHPAGSNIADLLDYEGPAGIVTTLDDFIEDSKGQLLENIAMSFKLNKKPAAETDFQIRIAVELSKGERYAAESLPIYLIP